MSLKRLVYYGAILGGWSAFFGWLLAVLLVRSEGPLRVALTAGLVGGAIGAGLNLVAGLANGQWSQLLKRLVPGLLGGGIGGAIGGALGELAFVRLNLPRAIGWMIMGAGIGVVEGLTERSRQKLRNGLIGGVIGGALGGFLFDGLGLVVSSRLKLFSNALAVVILGMCIGILIGVVKVALKEAWLTVLDGYRNGRQLILAEDSAVLGRAEYAALPFMGRHDAADLELEHARIRRQPDGRFLIEDNHTRTGVRVNDMRVDGSVFLKDGDIIKLGMNQVRFSQRRRDTGTEDPSGGTMPSKLQTPAHDAALSTVVGSPPQTQVPDPVVPRIPPAAPPHLLIPPVPRPAAVSPRRPPVPAPAPPSQPAAVPPGFQAPAKLSTTPPAAAVPPRLQAPAKPSSKPSAMPPRPQNPVQVEPAARMQDGMIACPSCGRAVPKGPRYCIICDLNF
jgi:hypothetical protein